MYHMMAQKYEPAESAMVPGAIPPSLPAFFADLFPISLLLYQRGDTCSKKVNEYLRLSPARIEWEDDEIGLFVVGKMCLYDI